MQQLSRHLSSEHRWQSFRSGHLDPPAEPCFASLPRVTVWLQSREVHSRHDLLPSSAAGEVSRAAAVIVPRLRGPDKAFDLVSRSGLFKILQKIGCPPKLLAIITSFHQDMESTVCLDGATSNAFPVSSGVKQGCVLAPILFGIFFSMLLQYAFVDCTEGVYVWTRSNGKLFNTARLRAKTKAYVVLIRELLFADDAALTSHSEEDLQHLLDKLSHACNEFGLTISLRTTNILAQGAESAPPPPPQSSPSTTRSWRLCTPSPTWAPPSQARLRSMLRSAAGSPKQLLSWPNSTSECGAMTC